MSLTRRRIITSAAALAVTGLLASCGLTGNVNAGNDKTIKLIVTESAPTQEPTKIAARILEEQGWDVQATYVTAIV